MRCKRGNPGTPMAARFSMTVMSSLIVSHTVTSMPKNSEGARNGNTLLLTAGKLADTAVRHAV